MVSCEVKIWITGNELSCCCTVVNGVGRCGGQFSQSAMHPAHMKRSLSCDLKCMHCYGFVNAPATSINHSLQEEAAVAASGRRASVGGNGAAGDSSATMGAGRGGPWHHSGCSSWQGCCSSSMASRDILVESFEPGASAAHFIRRHTPFRADIEAPGLDTTFACR